MAEPNQLDPQSSSSLQAAISNMAVQMLRESTGRGPTRAKTSIRDNVVVVILEETLTRGELTLAARGRVEQVQEMRRHFQEAIREESSARVAELTGREVVTMLSADSVSPDLAAQVYILDGPPRPQPDGPGGDGAPA